MNSGKPKLRYKWKDWRRAEFGCEKFDRPSNQTVSDFFKHSFSYFIGLY